MVKCCGVCSLAVYLFNVYRCLDGFDIVFYVFRQLVEVDWLSDWTCHGDWAEAMDAQ